MYPFNTPRTYSPTSSPSKAADLQQRLEKTQKQLEESERTQRALQIELQTIKREYKDFQVQQKFSSPSKSTEYSNLQDKLSEKDLIIARLKEMQNSIPVELVQSEIASFVQFAQTTQRKFNESESLNESRREKLAQSVKKFDQINSKESKNLKIKLSSFFDELHNFCDVFIESLIDKDIPLTSSLADDDEDGNISKALHDSEMQKLKLQNHLFRVQRRYDEENQQSKALAEQIKNEHLQISQFTTRLFQNSPIFDDERFVEKELDLIYSEITQRDAKIQETLNLAQSYPTVISDFLEANGVYDSSFNEDNIPAFKRLLNNVTERNNQNEATIQNIMNQLLLSSNDPTQKIISEIGKYMKCENDLNRLKNDYEALQNENDELSGKVEALQYNVSDLSNQNSEASDHFKDLSLKVKQLRNKVAELEAVNLRLENQKSKLDMKSSSLDTQNQLLEKQKSVVETSLASSTKELTKAAEETQRMKSTISDLTSRNNQLAQKVDSSNSINSELQQKASRLSDSYKSLSNDYQTLSQNHNDIINELKEKRSSLERLTKTLQNANQQISELKNKIADLQAEKQRLQIFEAKSDTLSEDNKAFQTEIDKKNRELSHLKSVKEELDHKNEEHQKLQESVDNIINAYKEEKEKNKILRKKAKDADFLREKTTQFEQQISKLSTELVNCQKLKKLVDQYEATINTLSTQSDNLHGQIEVISSNHADVQSQLINISSQHSALQRKYKDLKIIEKQEKSQLNQCRNDYTKSTTENVKLSNQLNVLQSENEAMKSQIKKLTPENLRLSEIENKYIKLVKTAELLSEQNNTFSEGLKTYEIQNNSLRKQADSQNQIISQLKAQLRESENDRKGISLELRTKNTVLENIENENTSIKHEQQNSSSKLVELQASQIQLSSQVETKNIIISNLTKEVTELRTMTKNLSNQLENTKEKLNQLKLQNNSLKSQINTKSLIIQNYESKIDQNIELGANDTEKYKTIQIENLRLKENARTYNSLYSQIEEFRNANQILTANNAKLEAKNVKLESINQSLQAQLEIKNRTIQSNERSIKELNHENNNLSNSLDKSSLKISELEIQTNATTSALLTKSSIERENQQLKEQNREYEAKNIKLKANVSQMKGQLSKLIQDNETLLRKIDNTTLRFEQIQGENRQLKNDLKIKSSPTKSDLMKQKDETISQLRSLVSSQEASISMLEKEAAQISDIKRKYDNNTMNRLVKKIEQSLSEFPIDRDFEETDNSLPAKLRSVASMVEKVKVLMDEKERSIERLSSMQKAQHDTILRITGSLSPK